ncbi:hypothetical protein BDF20DRAFT_973031 [Mycotypha africana]|uniref:uncharacterized protein n=1 Tax=Mycotypha africana TaxID=64632 RepID=UPI0022FFFD82|nr:uncharacterized protein BDF20DRAFT_973031 [Mycotypha africana]KAI8981999.1 hypothetical protein BDF20DRAFT_973031 [Mycotypha africana]
MPRHSKNNTASSVFTYHEAQSLEYGTKRQRLGRDSYRNYNACYLCLQTARDPVCCGEGHLACRECMYESIVQQKEAIKLEQKIIERKKQELEAKKQLEEYEAKQALLDSFDKTQNSVLSKRPTIRDPLKDTDTASTTKPVIDNSNDRKRKFEATSEKDAEGKSATFVDEELEKTAAQLRKEKEKNSKQKLGSFWVPSETPSAKEGEIKPTKTQVICTATEKTHPLTIKSLIDVKFTKEEKDKDKNICPACIKTLTNASKLSKIIFDSLVLRNCGHVICNTCIDMFVKKSKKCYVCEAKAKSKDIVDMTVEGTGFASGSTKAMAEKFSLAFQ